MHRPRHILPVHSRTKNTTSEARAFAAGVETRQVRMLVTGTVAGDADRAGGPALGTDHVRFLGVITPHLTSEILDTLLEPAEDGLWEYLMQWGGDQSRNITGVGQVLGGLAFGKVRQPGCRGGLATWVTSL